VTLLVISPDYASHLLPMATLATAWADAGERIVVATGDAVAPIVAGFRYEHMPLVLGRGSNAGIIRPEDQPPGEDERLRGFFAATREGMIATLAYQARARGDDLLWAPRETSAAVLRAVDAVRPDTIVVDHLAFAATLALRATGIDFADVVLGHPTALPVAGEIYGEALAWPTAIQPDPESVAALRRTCDDVRERFTATYNDALRTIDPRAVPVEDAFATHGRTVLFNYPERLHDPTRTSGLPAGHAFLGSLVRSEAAPPDVTAWLDVDDPRPIVYVSFGSFLSARTDVLRTVVDGLREQSIRVALASGTSDPTDLDAPVEWLVRPYLPQVAILDRASVAVTHAGNNSVTEALTAGVPLVAMPFSTDQFAGAAAIESVGAGVALDPNAVVARMIGDAVTRAGDLRIRGVAASLGEELRRETGPVRARRALGGVRFAGAISPSPAGPN
jgi:zeaxanthin glucosyltransferase